MPRKTDAALLDDSIKLYVAGRNGAEVCRETGISHSVLFRHLKKRGIPIWPRTIVDEKAVCRAYKSGLSGNVVAQRFDLERVVVDRILRDHGVERRGQSEAERLKWRGMSRAQRQAQVAAANAASRGRKMPFDALCKMAATRELNLSCRSSPYERELARMLQKRGIELAFQKAIGPYNCDMAASTVAVEIFGGNFHWHGEHLARSEERFRYMMNAGWNVLAVTANRTFPLTAEVADYVAAYIEEVRSNPPAICEYRVIWGAGDFTTGGSLDDDHFSIEPPFTSARDGVTGQYRRVSREA